jgi:AAA domain
VRWRRLVFDQLEQRGGIDARHHIGDIDDIEHDDHDQAEGSPQAGAQGVDDDHTCGATGDHELGTAGHDVRPTDDHFGAGARGRPAQDDDRNHPDHEHRSPGLHQHQPGVLGAAGRQVGAAAEEIASGALFVLVAGPPGSGKSSLAGPLAAELGLALLAKDEIKEALMRELGVPATVEESRRLGRAAVMAMLAMARSSRGAVLDSTFYPYTVPHLERLPGTLIEVRCRCPREAAQMRYWARSETRLTGHFDDERPPEELWNEQHIEPLGLGPLIEVDTTVPVDVKPLAQRIRATAGRPA